MRMRALGRLQGPSVLLADNPSLAERVNQA
jgi:hypothetical protein